jgi:hypothetical protein
MKRGSNYDYRQAPRRKRVRLSTSKKLDRAYRAIQPETKYFDTGIAGNVTFGS